MSFDVYQYATCHKKGAVGYSTKRITLVKKFADLHDAQEFVTGQNGLFIQFPALAIKEHNETLGTS